MGQKRHEVSTCCWKMVLVDLLHAGLSQAFNFWRKKKEEKEMEYLQSPIKQITIEGGVPLSTQWGRCQEQRRWTCRWSTGLWAQENPAQVCGDVAIQNTEPAVYARQLAKDSCVGVNLIWPFTPPAILQVCLGEERKFNPKKSTLLIPVNDFWKQKGANWASRFQCGTQYLASIQEMFVWWRNEWWNKWAS